MRRRLVRSALAFAAIMTLTFGISSDSRWWRYAAGLSALLVGRMGRAWADLPPRASCLDSLEGQHAWGPWSTPYQAMHHDLTSRRYGPPLLVDSGFPWWQERRCQCGNRDFRQVRRAG